MDSISFSHTFFSNHISLGLSLPTARTHTHTPFIRWIVFFSHSFGIFRWMMIMILEWECFKWILPNERVQMDASMLTTVFMWDFLKIIFQLFQFHFKAKVFKHYFRSYFSSLLWGNCHMNTNNRWFFVHAPVLFPNFCIHIMRKSCFA